MNKSLSIFSIILAMVAHLLCCGLPILLEFVSGGIGFFMVLQPFTPLITLIQGGILGWLFHRIYGQNLCKPNTKKVDKIMLWTVAVITFFALIFSHTNFFKSEEEILKKHRIEQFFKQNHKR